MTDNIRWLEARLNGEGAPVVIDGGMGTELEKSGVPMDPVAWSARALLSHPEQVRCLHESYIHAGAEVIITNTFASARHMLEPAGLGDQVGTVNRRAVELALEARDHAAVTPVAVAGSICEWVSADDPKWNRSSAIADSVREQAEVLTNSGVDLIAFEMCEISEHACAAIQAGLEFDLPLWLGLSARSFQGQAALSVFDDAERDFESLVGSLAGYPAMVMNIMHTPIRDIDEALELVRRYWSGPVGIYPESGYFKMPNWQFVDIIEPAKLVKLARCWVGDGVRLVGGCCGLGPEHIAALRAALND